MQHQRRFAVARVALHHRDLAERNVWKPEPLHFLRSDV
ncbi:hypothetical protein SDC9_169058 [bioreactor metagenome]|uniref:Uncharacterized protein n=1 Tax=bioreactor metagenome TaxID=1076179 RepID=A0A645G493_9ZZZZ